MKRFLANSSNTTKIIRFWKSLAFYKQARKDGSSNLDNMSLSSPSHNSLTTYIRVNGWRVLLMTERHILCNSRDVWNIIVTMTRHSSNIFSTTRTRLPLVVKKFTFTCQSYFPGLTVEKSLHLPGSPLLEVCSYLSIYHIMFLAMYKQVSLWE